MRRSLIASASFVGLFFALPGCNLFHDTTSGWFSNRGEYLERAKKVPNGEVGDVPLAQNPNAAIGLPRSLNPIPEVVVSRQQYVLSWNPQRRGLNWAMWRLRREDLGQGRSGKWFVDPALGDYLAKFNVKPVGYEEYKGSCFDRGHVVPSGDRNRDIEYNTPTFYLSNILPQTGFSNRIIWNHFEMHERDLVTEKRPELFLVSGPLYEQDWGSIGPNEDIPVPTAFFKVVLSKQVGTDPGVQNSELPLAVIVPNTLSNGQNPRENHTKLCEEFSDEHLGQSEGPRDDWKPFVTTIEEVERRSGIDIPSISETVRIGE